MHCLSPHTLCHLSVLLAEQSPALQNTDVIAIPQTIIGEMSALPSRREIGSLVEEVLESAGLDQPKSLQTNMLAPQHANRHQSRHRH